MHALTMRTVYREQRHALRAREDAKKREKDEKEKKKEKSGPSLASGTSQLARSCEGHPRAGTPRADVTTPAVTSPSPVTGRSKIADGGEMPRA